MFGNFFDSPQGAAAFKRAFVVASLAAAAAAVTWLASKPEYAVYAAIAGTFLTRFAAEGGYDTGRADNNDVNKSDVGYNPLVHRNK